MGMANINVLYLHSHDTGRYTSPYGYAVDTPNLQKLAERGVLFRQAFTANPTCSPSRACLLTGQYAHCNGMMGLAHRGGKLDNPSHTLPSYLRTQGYTTALAGLQHVGPHDEPADVRGYSVDLHERPTPAFDGPQGQDLATVHRAVEFLNGQSGGGPFFLDVGFFATHRTQMTPDGVQWHNGDDSPTGDSRYARPPACLPDTPETRADFADYAVAVNHLDSLMGAVLDALDAAGLADHTLVICTTDHGIAFPHMKCNLTDHGLGVMLTLAGPAPGSSATFNNSGPCRGFGGGGVCDAMVSQVDLFPTVCDVAGLAQPDWLQGVSLAPLVGDQTKTVRDEVFAEVNYHAAHEPKRAVRTERYKYIKRIAVRGHPVLPNVDPGASKDLLLERGWNDRPQVAEQLFDLTFDPQEFHNVIGDPGYAEAATEMRGRLDRWMQATDDPALEGKIELPGFTVNTVDALHPSADGTVVTS